MLTTDRLVLRRWRDGDREPFAALNGDPEVMEFFVATMTREQSDAFVEVIEAGITERGHGMWAVELAETGEFIGCAGLLYQTFDAHFTPAFEIAYRFARSAWGHGYATEAAKAAVAYAFEEVGLTEIVSMTAVLNTRSQAVMGRLGMSHDPADDFDHPRVPAGHPLRPHVLYRLSIDQWRGPQPTSRT